MATYTQNVAETLHVTATSTPNANLVVGAQDGFTLTSSRTVKMIAKPRVSETLKLRASSTTTGLFHLMLANAFSLRSRSSASLRVTLNAIIHFSTTMRSSLVARLVETIELSARLSVRAALANAVYERVRLAGYAGAGWFLGLQDSLRLHSTTAASYHAQVQLAETVTLDSALAVYMLCYVDASDEVDFSDGIASLRALYRQTLADVVDFAIAIRQPDGTTTTWAMNSRTGAVTEYLNYAFNSTVEWYDGSYLGAGEDGNLYTLSGSSDNGAPIIADMVGGILDLGGSHFTQLKAVYLGVRASGAFYLKLTTNNDVTRTYQVKTRPMETARFDIGKGLRSRYIQWELVSAGQQFDLDTIEFVPLISTRRI